MYTILNILEMIVESEGLQGSTGICDTAIVGLFYTPLKLHKSIIFILEIKLGFLNDGQFVPRLYLHVIYDMYFFVLKKGDSGLYIPIEKVKNMGYRCSYHKQSGQHSRIIWRRHATTHLSFRFDHAKVKLIWISKKSFLPKNGERFPHIRSNIKMETPLFFYRKLTSSEICRISAVLVLVTPPPPSLL